MSGAGERPQAAAARLQPVLLARGRGDGATCSRSSARALARDFDVTVVTGKLRDEAERAGRIVARRRRDRPRPLDGLRPREHLAARRSTTLTYLLGSSFAGLRARRPDVVLCMTDPPVIADIALLVARRFGAPLVVVSQDVFPEIAVELKRLENPVARRPPRALIALLPAARRPGRRDRRDDARPARGRRARGRERIARDPELGGHRTRSTPAAARQRLGARARARRPLRRHALRQRRPRAESRRARPRDDVPPRPRRPRGRDRSAAAPATPTLVDARRAARGRPRPVPALPAARARSRSRSRRPTSTSSGSRAGSPATSSRAASTGSSRSAGR